MPTIIEVCGLPGSGRTTVATLLQEELSTDSLLLLDATADAQLTQLLTLEKPALTLGEFLSTQSEKTSVKDSVRDSKEAVDWAFHDMLLSAGENCDLLPLGELPQSLSVSEQEKLKYGLSRLIESYDFVVLDGHHPELMPALPAESTQRLWVATPEHVGEPDFLVSLQAGSSPALLLLNRVSTDAALPESFQRALENGEFRLLGRLPKVKNAEAEHETLAHIFQNCLLRMDIPFKPH